MATDFGTDTLCVDSLRTGRMATGVMVVAQRAYHRLITPVGMLRGGEEEAVFGFDLSGLIGRPAMSTASIAGRIKSELLKDRQILTVSVDVLQSTVGASVSYTITIECTTDVGPFELVLAVDDVSASLLRISEVT
jgi:hypothetical protein